MLVFWQRTFRSAWQGFIRNGWLSLVAVVIMAQALLIVSILVGLNLVISATIQSINERIDVAVFLKETATEQDALSMKADIENYEGVREVVYVSSKEAMDKFLVENRHSKLIKELVPEGDSFLPPSLEIKVIDPNVIESVVNRMRSSSYSNLVSETSLEDNQKIIDRLRNMGGFVQSASGILAIILMIIALLIIFNTIGVTIFTRKQEIEIMKLVGATDWYIRWPFILEGLLYGIIATAVTLVLLMGGYYLIVKPLLATYLISTGGTPLFTPSFVLILVVLQLALGLLVGGMSSYMATRKHLAI